MCMVAEQTLLQLGATTHRLLKLFVMETKLICLMCNAVTSQTCKITEGHQHKLLFIVVVREAVLWARLTQPFRTKTTNRYEAEVRIVGKYVGPGHLLCLTSVLFFPATAVSSSSLLLFLRFLLCLCLELQSTSKMIKSVLTFPSRFLFFFWSHESESGSRHFPVVIFSLKITVVFLFTETFPTSWLFIPFPWRVQ